MTLTLTVYRATPSLNEFVNLRKNDYRYVKLRKTWLHDIGTALLEVRAGQRQPLAWPRPPRERVFITVTRYAPAHRWLDPDNLAGGLKPVLDALKVHELIDDDSPKAIELVANQAISETNLARWTAIRLSLDPPMQREVHA